MVLWIGLWTVLNCFFAFESIAIIECYVSKWERPLANRPPISGTDGRKYAEIKRKVAPVAVKSTTAIWYDEWSDVALPDLARDSLTRIAAP